MNPPSILPSAMQPSTTQLVQRCLHGDSDAWALLVQRYARLVHAIPARHGLVAAEIEDVGQEVFIALAQHLHTVDDPERLPAWLITTARRLSWRTLQRRGTELSLDEGQGEDEDDKRASQREAASPLPTPDDLVHDWARQQALSEALRHLQARCRELLQLIFLDPAEPSYDTISAQLGIPKGSIGPTRNRCMQQLRTILEGLGVHSSE